MSAPSVLVVILNWNGERDTVQAIRSVQASDYPSYSILVIDNGSRIQSSDYISKSCPGVEIARVSRNLGYAGGNNLGFERALEKNFDYCLILNNDATVGPDTISRLVAAYQTDPKIGIAGPVIYRSDRPHERFYPAWKIDWQRWLFYRVPEGKESPHGITNVDFVQGCAMMLSRDLLRHVGLFDERYYLYCEDADLCIRAQRAGYRTIEISTAHAWHKGYGSSGHQSALKIYYGLRNRLLFIGKFAQPGNRARLRFQLIALDAGEQVWRAGRRLVGGDTGGLPLLRAIFRALVDWLLNRYGKGPDWLFKR